MHAAILANSDFWSNWGDGQAELTGYQLTFPRYGEPRQGVAVAIFVTETFSNSARVKADPGKHPPSDEFPVMKLNLVQDFQTGVYDYNEMLSTFIALGPVNGRPAGYPTKIVFSSQEWCGQAYEQLLFDDRAIRSTSHSYFDGEGDQQSRLTYPRDGVSEDALLLWTRGMAEPRMDRGQTRKAPVLISLQTVRHAHVPPVWKQATLARSAVSRKIQVPAGEFVVEVWTAEIEQGLKKTFYVETAAPYRVISWESSRGERAEMLSSERMKYWQLNEKGGETYLRRLGLSPRPPKTT